MKGFLKSIIVFIITLEARLILRKYKPIVVAVTGSVGKTTTKDAIYSVLQTKYFVRKSEKSFNSEIGVPLTIMGCPNVWASVHGWFSNIVAGLSVIFGKKPYPRVLVLEVGADRPHDIERIAKWLRPNVSVLTRLPTVPVHVEYFKSPEAVADEKLSLVKHSLPGGMAVFCFDDEKLRARPEFSSRKCLSYGFSEGATVRGVNDEILYDETGKPIGMRFEINHGADTLPLSLHGVVGRQALYGLLAAVSVGLALGLTLGGSVDGLKSIAVAPGRMRILSGVKNSVIIDDTYNSSPVAVLAALRTLESLKTDGRKVAVLGDMFELGKYSVDEHRGVGKSASFLNRLILLGVRARDFGVGARSGKMLVSKIKYYESLDDVDAYLKKDLKTGDIILVKGSQGMRMEKIVASLLSEPAKAKEFLVRQDEEWAKR